MNAKEIMSRVDHTLLKQTATWEDIQTICDEAVKYQAATVMIPSCFISRIKEKYGDAKVCRIFVAPTDILDHKANLTHKVVLMNPKLLNKFKSSLDKFLMEFKDYALSDIDKNFIQEALVTHHLTIDCIKKDYVEKIVKEKV